MKTWLKVVAVLLVAWALITEPWKPDIEWSDSPPHELHGVWIEQSEDISTGIEFADTIQVSPDILILSDPNTDGHLHRRRCSPIRKVSRTGDEYVIFCGNRNDDFIADTRIEFDANDAFDEVVVGEVVGTGYGENAYFSIGRFTKVR